MSKLKNLPLTYFGNPILRKKAKKIPTSEIRKASFQKLIGQMLFTMRKARGVGLAAPQIGESIQLAVVEIKKTDMRSRASLKPTVIINPEVVLRSKAKINDWEGCLSFPAARGLVPRYKSIVVKYLDESADEKVLKLKDFQARVFQHEIDHLNGILFVDRMKDMGTLMTLGEFEQRILEKNVKGK